MNQKLEAGGPTMMSATPVASPPIGTGGVASRTARSVQATRALTRESAARYVWAAARLSMGWVFLWAFLDKMFGLGHETASAQAVIHGGNPTKGFLSGSVGPFSDIYHSIAGASVVNLLFMVGLVTIGVGLMLGIYMRIACAAGVLMLLLMWTASLPPANNVFMDDHIIYALLLTGLALVAAGNTLGLGARWARTEAVRRFPWLA